MLKVYILVIITQSYGTLGTFNTFHWCCCIYSLNHLVEIKFKKAHFAGFRQDVCTPLPSLHLLSCPL